MSDYWTLHVKDFAKIREAKIEAAPLTFFVGDNNSGKSYLLSLMWGLTGGVNFSDRAPIDDQNISDSLVKVRKLLDFWQSREADTRENSSELPLFQVDQEEHGILAEGFCTLLQSTKKEVIAEIFNADDIHAESIHVSIPFQVDFQVGFQKQDMPALPWILQHRQRIQGFRQEGVVDFLGRYVDMILDRNVFIPAPRTGFLLTLKTLAQRSIRSNFSREPKSGDNLTGPQVSYLERLTALNRNDNTSQRRTPVQWILDYVERDIINGEIDITDTPLPEVLYKPNELNKKLPLYLTSGVVTEIAGFLSLMKYGQFGWVCIYEEPEMCLHPELQWKMARVLVRMVNSGCAVWASTHSDVIIQHVNNMIKLSNHPDGEQLRKEHDYDEDDVISSDKVRMYQFDVDANDHKTDVKPLECGVNGFRIPTFGRVLREMRDEVWSFRIEKGDIPRD